MGLLKAIHEGWEAVFNPQALLSAAAMAEGNASVSDPGTLLRRLDFQLRQKLSEGAFGDKRSLARGQGLDFTNLREYVAGDDIRKIDWNVFARTFTPFVREYQEEKQLTVWLVMDLTPSMFFGQKGTKVQKALEVAGLLGLIAVQQGHRLGGFSFTAKTRSIIQPKAGHLHLQRILREWTAELETDAAQAVEMGPDRFEQVCREMARIVSKRSTVFFLSDFLSPASGWEKALGDVSRQCDLHYMVLRDPVECALPENIGILSLFDPETLRVVEIDTDSPKHRAIYQKAVAEAGDKLMANLSLIGKPVPAMTDQDPVAILWNLLRPHSPGFSMALKGGV